MRSALFSTWAPAPQTVPAAAYFSSSLYLEDLVHCGMTVKDADKGVKGTVPQTEGAERTYD